MRIAPAIKWNDPFTHLLVLGKSGMGKSSLLANLWHSTFGSRILIEPAGSLALNCLDTRSLYVSIDNPTSLNPMITTDPNTAADILAEAINQVITATTANDSLTVNMRVILVEAVKECFKRDRRTIIELADYIEGMKGFKEAREGLYQRLRLLTLGMEEFFKGDGLDLTQLIKLKKSLILDCSKLSSDKMIFLGTLLTQQIKNYFRYNSINQPLTLFIDECHNFINPNFFDILKEGRKYKISAVLATQDFNKIPAQLCQSLLSVGSIIAFRLSYKEAVLVAKEMNLEHSTLQFLEKFHAYISQESRFSKGIEVKKFKTQRLPFRRLNPPPSKPKSEELDWFYLEEYNKGEEDEYSDDC